MLFQFLKYLGVDIETTFSSKAEAEVLLELSACAKVL